MCVHCGKTTGGDTYIFSPHSTKTAIQLSILSSGSHIIPYFKADELWHITVSHIFCIYDRIECGFDSQGQRS